MPKIVNRNEKRIQILEGLKRCLLEKPFNETSIKDIAREAGVNHGLLHYYFKSKEEILLSFIDHTAETLDERTGRYLSDLNLEEDISPEMFEKVMLSILKEITYDHELSRNFVEICSIANYNSVVREKVQSAYRRWKDKTAKIISGHSADTQVVSDMSFTLVAFLEGMSSFSVLFDRKEFDIKKVLDILAGKFYQYMEIGTK